MYIFLNFYFSEIGVLVGSVYWKFSHTIPPGNWIIVELSL